MLLKVDVIDKAHQGKMQCYLRELLDANLDRPWARGAVFNGSDLVFFQATRSKSVDGTVDFQVHRPLSMDTGRRTEQNGIGFSWALN